MKKEETKIKNLKILHLGDTHNQHLELQKQMKLTAADVIIHSGDFSGRGGWEDSKLFLEWFSSLDYKHKILIPGNHDFFFESLEENKYVRNQLVPKNITLLIKESVTIEGVKFWGSPYTPWYYDWAFQIQKHEEDTMWEDIPDDVDVLITHGPAYGTLDLTEDNLRVGCPGLKRKIPDLKNLKLHLFGHIHEQNGQQISENGNYLSINSSVLDSRYRLTQSPHLIEINEEGIKCIKLMGL